MPNKIYLRRLRPYKYQLMREYEIVIALDKDVKTPVFTDFIRLQRRGKDDGWLSIDRGYAWDGPSGPTVDTRSFMRGSLVHDALYQLMRQVYLPLACRKYADDLLRQICLEDGMNRFRAWYVWKNVRLFGGAAAQAREEPPNEIIIVP